MIAYIKGKLMAKLENSIIVETGGIGYEINVTLGSEFFMKNIEEEVSCYTYMQVREDDMSLFGFSDRETLKMFKLLLTVNGIGAKAAMSVLSSLDCISLATAVKLSDDKTIAKAQGVGKKTAQRIVLELKDKVEDFEALEQPEEENETADVKNEAVEALISLGYSRGESLAALSGIEALSVEEYIKKALKNLI